MLFKPIHKHHDYSKIRYILQFIQNKKLSLNQIIQAFSLFNYITKHDSLPEIEGNSISLLLKKIYSFLFNSSQSEKNYQQNSSIKDLIGQFKIHADSYKELTSPRYSNDILNIFSFIASFILAHEDSAQMEAIPILLSNSSTNKIELTKNQVVYILCLMTFNLIPKQKYHYDSQLVKKFNYRNNNFSFIFNEQEYKTRVILEYFKILLLKDSIPSTNNKYQKAVEKQMFTIKRETVELHSFQRLISEYSSQSMSQFQILSDYASIEEFVGSTKVDFANKYIGGGALSNGCVQEEIMFANHTEMYVSIILCEAIRDNQAILFEGFNKYFKNQGYSYGTKFDGHQSQQIYKKSTQFIVAIDAIDFSRDQMKQFNFQLVKRQILKAFAGFKSNNKSEQIITGNWGCGVFKGDLKLKFIIQWIACSMARKKMKYCPYGQNRQLKDNIQIMKNFKWNQSKKSVYQMYIILQMACKQIRYPSEDIIRIMDKVLDRQFTQVENKSNKYQQCGIVLKKQSQMINNAFCLLNQHQTEKKFSKQSMKCLENFDSFDQKQDLSHQIWHKKKLNTQNQSQAYLDSVEMQVETSEKERQMETLDIQTIGTLPLKTIQDTQIEQELSSQTQPLIELQSQKSSHQAKPQQKVTSVYCPIQDEVRFC